MIAPQTNQNGTELGIRETTNSRKNQTNGTRQVRTLFWASHAVEPCSATPDARRCVAQPSSPNGQLRRRQFRNPCNSASVCGSFTSGATVAESRIAGRDQPARRGPRRGPPRPGRTPPPLLRTRHQLGPHRIPLDVPQHRQQMLVRLDRKDSIALGTNARCRRCGSARANAWYG